MILEFGLFLLGVLGFIILFVVMARLSARMGEGMGIPVYYLLYYMAISTLILILPAGWSIHYAGEIGPIDTLFALLTTGNVVAIAASHKYWWWLRNELWKEGRSDE